MIIVYGTRFYGKIRACGRSFFGTQFFHIWYVPLIPLGTHLVLDTNGTSYRTMPASFSFKSMMAGYLRVWGPIGAFAAMMIGISGMSDLSDEPAAMVLAGVFTGVVVLALVALCVAAFAFIGRLSDKEKQQLSVYALHTGYYVDPGDMGNARQAIRDALLAKIADRARGLASMGYRMGGDVSQAWPHVALDPTHNDDGLVTAALTLARLDGSVAQGAWKLQLEQLHEQLWQRLVRMNPPYLHAHRQFG